MKIVAMERAMMQCLREKIAEFEETLRDGVSVEGAAKVIAAIQNTVQAVGTAGLKVWLEADDETAEVVSRDGQTLRFKYVSAKDFVTPLGHVQIARRLYQADHGGACYVPLDRAWGMVGEFATPEVREAVAYAVGLVTPEEAAQLFSKMALFRLSVTTLKDLIKRMGEWLEEHPEIIEQVRNEEEPPPQTKVVCASLDGVNVRLAETGPKPGRPVAGADEALAASCFKNAMVGSVTLYGEVPADAKTPQRLQTRYVARMPETNSPTFHRQFEAEVAATSSRCSAETARIVLIDGAKALWHYVDTNPQFAGWEKLLDFQHTMEHLTLAADAGFGKGTPQARRWLDKKREVLLTHDCGGRRVLRALNRLARRRLGKAARTELEQQRQFFRNNYRRMTYATFRQRGLPIGSGPVEAAAKTLVKMRLCRSGMRWTRTGGQHVLTIRTLIKSQRWDRVWSHYMKTRQLT